MNKLLLCAALAGMISAGAANAQSDSHAGKEKCFGIAKAGKNDCKAADASHSCAGQSTSDNGKSDWKYVDQGSCAKSGGSLKAG